MPSTSSEVLAWPSQTTTLAKGSQRDAKSEERNWRATPYWSAELVAASTNPAITSSGPSPACGPSGW